MINVRLVGVVDNNLNKQTPKKGYLFWCDCGNYKQRRSVGNGGFCNYEKQVSTDIAKHKGEEKRIGRGFTGRMEPAIMCEECYAHILRCDFDKVANECVDKTMPEELAKANNIPQAVPHKLKQEPTKTEIDTNVFNAPQNDTPQNKEIIKV